MDLDAITAESGQRALELIRGADHRVRVAGRAGLDDRCMSVRGDRHPGPGWDHGADGRVSAQAPLDRAERALE
jgi:hypothetical protein